MEFNITGHRALQIKRFFDSVNPLRPTIVSNYKFSFCVSIHLYRSKEDRWDKGIRWGSLR